MKVCHIVGAGEFRPDAFHPADGDMVIAVDAGIRHCARYDAVVGDFDSLGYVPQGEHVYRHPVMKDDTDTMLAVKLALEAGCDRLYLHGCVGGRPDHTMANYQTLAYIAARGAQGLLMEREGCAACLRNGEMTFAPGRKGILSVFAWGGAAAGVSLQGPLYRLENAVLTCDVPLGVSNEFIGEQTRVSVRSGTLLVMWQNPIDPEPKFS